MNKYNNKWPYYSSDEVKAVSDVLSSGKVNYWTGTHCRNFESEFSAWCGVTYSVALANGTVAIDLALKALNVGDGDEVIVTPRSFIASVSSIVNSGATPIFCDVDMNSGNIDINEIKKLLTNKTKAIICVHLAGWPCDMDPIMALANEHNFFVIEDCAQAHGAVYKSKMVGSIGHIGCWSFCQDKIMSTGGEGGMVTTNDHFLWEKMWSYKDHGKNFNSTNNHQKINGFRWVHDSFGTNWRMTEMQAAIGRLQLKKVSKWTMARNKNANSIIDTLSKYPLVRVPQIDLEEFPGSIHAYYKLYAYINQEFLSIEWSRDLIVNQINEITGLCFHGSCPEIYLEKAFDGTNFKPHNRLSNAKKLGEASLMFLVHPTLSEAAINNLKKTIDLVFSKALRVI